MIPPLKISNTGVYRQHNGMRIRKIHILFIGIFLLSACGLKKKVTYFQGEGTESSTVKRSYTPVFKSDDLLSIVVSADDPETAIQFNLVEPVSSTMQRGNAGYSTGAPALRGYLLDSAGFVEMPVLGKVKLGGLNRMEASNLLREKLKEYLTNPIVQIHILNFKVTVLGDVRSPGTFNIPNERITILEAIGLAGDLTITGNRKSVKVIRNEGGVETQTIVDLTSQDVFNSPVYYLDQNDVVYIEPNAAARTQSTIWAKTGTFFVSISSVIVSTIAVLTNK